MGSVTFGVHGRFYPLSSIYETALLAEELGLDAYWLGDRIDAVGTSALIEVWSALAAVAVKTRRIRLGIGVTDPFRRNPAMFAHTAAALDHIAEGRLDPGVGVGEAVNLTPYGIEMHRPLARLEEFVRLAKQYWTGEPVSFAGEFFQARDAVVRPTPIQRPHPPVWIAANTPASLRVTGRVGDGWMPAAKSAEMYREDLAVIRAEAARVGRDPGAIVPGLFSYILISDDREHTRRVVEGFAREVLAWWQSSLKRLGVEAGDWDISLVNYDGSPESVEKRLAASREIPMAAVAQLICFGTADEVAERLRAFVAAGVEHFCFVSLDGLGDPQRWAETTRVLAERVIPAVRERV